MSAQTHAPVVAPAQDVTPPTVGTAPVTANSESGPPADAAGTPRGGGTYVVRRGDTLSQIALTTYGAARYWHDIARANPTQVFRAGELILVGAELTLPTITVPGTTPGTAPTAPAPSVDPAAPVSPATEPRNVCTEFGDFAIYPDDFIGPLPPTTGTTRAVREAEFSALEASWNAEQAEKRAAVETEVTDLLSYGAFDWAITDGDATRALQQLGSLPMGQLQQAIGNIPTIGRLLENLPDSQRGTPAYARVLVALGPARVGPYLRDLLTYGVFHWAVTDADARAVLGVLSLLPSDQFVQVLADLGQPLQLRFLQNLPARGSALTSAQKIPVKGIFDACPDSNMELLTLAFEVRFNLTVRGSTGQAWDAAGLRRSWGVLETLPPQHVEGNPEILQWIRDGNTATGHSGWYDGGSGEDGRGAGFDYTTANLATANQSSQFDTDGDGTISASEQDPLHGVNRFDKVVRHEVGHAVDVQIGGSASYCIGNPGGGNWTDYGGDATACITAMVNATGAGISAAPGTARSALIAGLVAGARADERAAALQARIAALPEYVALTAAEQAAVDADPVFSALSDATDNPWYRHLPSGGTPIGARIYQRSYSSQWTSYDVATRANKVSQYQYRAPGEWFAEAYAAYYQPNADGTCDHHYLGTIDPAAKGWFDNNVDPVVGTR